MTGTNGATPIRFYFDGMPVEGREGDTIAMALWASGILALRRSPKRNEPRGVFCGIGICQECVVWIDGRRRESCMTKVRPELLVTGSPDGKT